MSKYIVETFYTCSFKIVHELNELDEKSLSDIDNRQDGNVEIIDVTVNNRKTKKIVSSRVLFLIIKIKPINKFKQDFIKSFGLPSSR